MMTESQMAVLSLINDQCQRYAAQTGRPMCSFFKLGSWAQYGAVELAELGLIEACDRDMLRLTGKGKEALDDT